MRLSTLRAASAAAKAGAGRAEQNHAPQGLTAKSLKHHFSLYPLFVSLGFAVCLVVGFSTRMIFKASDISWKKEAAPYNYYSDKQYKFMSPRNIKYEQSTETKEAQKLLKPE
jgi:hypothetical protein